MFITLLAAVCIQMTGLVRNVLIFFVDPAFRFPVSKLDNQRLHHTLGYIENIVNHKDEFILDEALAVCLHKVHSAKFQVRSKYF